MMKGLYSETAMPEAIQWVQFGMDIATICGVCILFCLVR